MKVTALIPDDIVKDVQEFSHGKNITESLVIALREWNSIQKLRILTDRIKRHPLVFRNNFAANSIRVLNRQQ